MKMKSTILALAAVSLGISASYAQTTLSAGDVKITGYNSDAPDSFSFVLLRDVAANTALKITDGGFNTANVGAATAFRSTENGLYFTFTGAATAGTVVRVTDNTGTPTFAASSGYTSGFSGTIGGLTGVSASGDQLLIYQGTGAPTLAMTTNSSGWNVGAANSTGTTFSGTLVEGLTFRGTGSTTSWLTTGSASSNTSYLPSTLNVQDANLAIGFNLSTHGRYLGTTSGLTSDQYAAAISNVGNWGTANGNITLATTGFSISAASAVNWDANGTGNGSGGAGTWNSTTTDRFRNGTSGQTYLRWVDSASGNDHTAVFGGTAGTVTVSGGVTASGLKFDTTGYTLTGSTITLSGSTAPTVDTGALAATVNSQLAGTQGLTKIGSGTLTLGSANNYTGDTTIKEGTLKLGASGTIADSTSIVVGDGGSSGTVLDTTDKAGFSISSTQTLSGIGTVNVGSGKTLTIEGTHSVGNVGTSGGVGTQSVTGNLNYTSSIFNWDLNPSASTPDPGAVLNDGAYDKMNVTGTITGTSSVFNVVLGAGKSFTDAFWNTDKTWTDVFTGSSAPDLASIFTTFGGSGVASNGTVTGRGQFGFTGSALTFTAVPEPSSALAGLLIAAGLLRRRRVG